MAGFQVEFCKSLEQVSDLPAAVHFHQWDRRILRAAELDFRHELPISLRNQAAAQNSRKQDYREPEKERISMIQADQCGSAGLEDTEHLIDRFLGVRRVMQ